jgi:hypothetical protein
MEKEVRPQTFLFRLTIVSPCQQKKDQLTNAEHFRIQIATLFFNNFYASKLK